MIHSELAVAHLLGQRYLELMGQINIHVNLGSRVLGLVRSIKYCDRILKVLYTNLINRYLAPVPAALNILHRLILFRRRPVRRQQVRTPRSLPVSRGR